MNNFREITAPLLHPLDGMVVQRKERKRSDGRVQELIQYLTKKVGGYDGNDADNRRACWTLILRAEKKDPHGDAVASIKRLIDWATSADSWHHVNATSFRYLLNNAEKIARERRSKRPAPLATDTLNTTL